MWFWIVLGIAFVIYSIYKVFFTGDKDKKLSETKTEKNSKNDVLYTSHRTSTTHIVGVRFENQASGCYYYIGDNNIYHLNDTVEVPTQNGNKTATIVFTKIYNAFETLPYPKCSLKTVIRKIPKPNTPPKSSDVKLSSRFSQNDYDYPDYRDDAYDYNSRDDFDDYDPMEGYHTDNGSFVADGWHTDDDGNWEPDDIYGDDEW